MENLLEKRIAKLERNVWYYRLAFFAAVVFAVMSFNQKQPVPEVLQAKKIQVVDERGKVQVELKYDEISGKVSVYNSGGYEIANLFSTTSGSGAITVYDNKGKKNEVMSATEGGGGFIGIYGNEENELINFGVNTANSGYGTFYDEDGKETVNITSIEKGGGFLSLSRRNTEQIVLSTSEAGGRISAKNYKGTRVGYIGTENDYTGAVALWNSAGTQTLYLPK